jgi:exopolysaccharide biosynthesis polyprenyl glycosylphosphotransferase
MLRERQNFWRRLNLLGDILLTFIALLATVHVHALVLSASDTGILYTLVLLVWTLLLYGPSRSYFYRLKSLGLIVKELYWALGKSFLAFTAMVFFIGIELPPAMLLAFFVTDALLLTASRLILAASLGMYRRRGRSHRNVIIIGTGKRAQEAADRIVDNKHWGIHIVGFLDYHRTGLWRYRDIPLVGHPDSLPGLIGNNQVDYVIVAVDSTDLSLTGHAFAVSEEMGVTVCLLSDIYFHPISRATSTSFMDFPAVVYASTPSDRMQLFFKECVDRIGALAGLLVSIPVTLAVALAVKLEDGGPIFFKQVRSGRNGRTFTMYKFRTMVPDAEKLKEKLRDKNEMSGPVFKIKNDPRITRIGALLRKTSIDELPQLINILKGDMSLVGPRPPLPKEVLQYDRWQRRKLSVKPGLTCLWQVNGRNQIGFEDWMKLDLEYIDNWSLWLDTKILAKTVPAVLKRDGAS